MWFEDIWNIPLYVWLLVVIFAAVVFITTLLRRRNRAEPVKENLEYFCRCYARGEINREDFEELKKDLLEFEKQFDTTKKCKPTPRMNIRGNNKQPVR
ncbi:SHOCT domain-containing protein [Fodinibius sp.]|uniref:SHOCT domain-containing protein n=1 Tax=Fodinibius sp. TaxID=1872440 RepID=UPI002ACD8148|nr:SHOCT domain-containing protein [Fodinibius sp.]MDZ7660499.1 SHOCT domain-containing protein [Fodinibius sp.]